MPDFKRLLVSKARFIIPATIFFVVYYFTLPVLVGWFPKFMEQKVVRRSELGLSLRALTIFHGVDYRLPLRERGCGLGPPGGRAARQIHQAQQR